MWILIFVSCIICGGFSAYIANNKNRSAVNWFFLGLIFGIFALITIGVISPLQKISTVEHNVVKGSGSLRHWTCRVCGQVNGFAISVCSKCGGSK